MQVVLYVKEEMKRNDLPETAVIGLLWTCVMNAVEWNKKEELVAEQALKHLKVMVGFYSEPVLVGPLPLLRVPEGELARVTPS